MAGTTTRQRYLDAVVEHMVASGRTDLTLTVLADAAGTSDRMLVYYFKTRDALLQEAMATIRIRRRKQLANALNRLDRDAVRHDLGRILEWWCGPDNRAATRLYLDAAGRAARNEPPFVDFLRGVINDAVAEAEMAARRLGAQEIEANVFGVLFAGVSMSLATDAIATGERERVGRAIDAAADSLVGLLTRTDGA